jgi:hypothetical protein
MQSTRLPLQIQIKNERIAVVSDVLSGFLTGEGYALRLRTLQRRGRVRIRTRGRQDEEVEEEEE